MNHPATLPARPRPKREKVSLRVIKGGFAPADKYAESLLRNRNLHIGDVVNAEITKLRNPKFNRLAHKIGQLCAENIEAFTGVDAHVVIKRLQLEGRIACDEIGIFIPGFGMATQFIPRSMSFESMDELDYHDAVKKICRFIAYRYWQGLEPEQIENMASAMVDE